MSNINHGPLDHECSPADGWGTPWCSTRCPSRWWTYARTARRTSATAGTSRPRHAFLFVLSICPINFVGTFMRLMIRASSSNQRKFCMHLKSTSQATYRGCFATNIILRLLHLGLPHVLTIIWVLRRLEAGADSVKHMTGECLPSGWPRMDRGLLSVRRS